MDSDPHQNIMDPQHCLQLNFFIIDSFTITLRTLEDLSWRRPTARSMILCSLASGMHLLLHSFDHSCSVCDLGRYPNRINTPNYQFCESGSARSRSGIRIRDEQPGSYFLELRNPFFLLKYFNSLMRLRDPRWKKSDPGCQNLNP